MRLAPLLLTLISNVLIGMTSSHAANSAQAQPACDRQCLVGFLETYLDALVNHDPKRLPLARTYKVTQNGHPLKLGEDIWKTAGEVKLRNYFADPTTGQAAFLGLIEENGIQVPLGFRLKVVDRKITEIETILTRSGPRQRLPSGNVRKNPIFETVLPENERTPRDMMIQTAHSYFDSMIRHDGDIVKWDSTCNRRENYVQMTNNIDLGSPLGCADGMNHYTYHIYDVPNRRIPIVDEERGVVYTIVQLDRREPKTNDPIYLERSRLVTQARGDAPGQPYRPSFLLLFEAFKIRKAKIRDIEAVMLTTDPGSPTGWNEPEPAR